MRVIFLDIDGVLNNRSCFMNGNISMPVSSVDENPGWDHSSVNALRWLVGESVAHIVLTSTWRFSMRDLVLWWALFEQWHNWPNVPIVGFTGEHFTGNRGSEIREWLDERPFVTSHVILDDDNDFAPEQPLIRTSFEEGLTIQHCIQALEILENDS